MELLSVGNLVAHALQAGLLAAGAAVLARALSRWHPQVRLALWQSVLAGSVALPFVQPWRPASYQFVVSEAVGAAASGSSPAAGFVVPGLLLPAIGSVLAAGVLLRLAWLGAGL